MARLGWLLLGAALIALAACERKSATPPAQVQPHKTPEMTAPARKPGLWEQRVSNGSFVQVTRVCLDAATDARLSWWGEPATQGLCGKNLVTHRPDGAWAFSSVCDRGSGGHETTAGVATGDFSTHYQLKAQSSTTGAAAPQMNGTRSFVLDAAWQGACPAGMKPGDMAMPGGAKVNLLDMG